MKKRKAGIVIFVIVLIITAVRIKSMDSHRISGRILAENIAGPGMPRLVEQSMQAWARKTSVTEIAVKERKHPQAALTFDDGPDIRYTPLLLDGLKERNVRVSFFLLGEKVEQYPELVERMQKEGHLVGNHTYHHVQLNKLNETKAREEILKTNNLIYETTGVYPLYLRPPFGAWKKNLELCVEMLPVFWTIDTLDWKVKNTEKIVRTVKEQIEDGAIILMHDEYDTSVEAALQVVDELKNQGYELVTVSADPAIEQGQNSCLVLIAFFQEFRYTVKQRQA